MHIDIWDFRLQKNTTLAPSLLFVNQILLHVVLS